MGFIKKFQEGGNVAPQQAPAQPAGQDQMMAQLEQMAAEIIQQMGPDAAAMLAQMIMEILQSAPEQVGAAPAEQQFMRCGGKITKKKKVKKACGGKMRK